MRILILGAHGFIGQRITNYFYNTGHHILGLGRARKSTSENFSVKLEFIESEIQTTALTPLLKRVEAVVNCAGTGSVQNSFLDPNKDFNDNVLATQILLEALRKHKEESGTSPHLVLFSSAAVYGQARQLPISEEDALRAEPPYGLHKTLAEGACEFYSRNYQLPISVLRVFSCYGPGLKKQLFWDVCSKLKSGVGEFSGTGGEIRDWIHVDDVCRLCEVVFESKIDAFRIFNCGSGEGHTVKQAITNLAHALHFNGKISFSGESRKGDPDRFVADISKASQLGWKVKHSFDEGLKQYAQWFLQGKF